jgi:hypothetical protein
MSTRRLWPVGVLVLVVGIFLVGRSMREHLGLDPSPGAVGAWLEGGGGVAGLLALVVALPLAHPTVRRYLLAARR